MRNTRPTVKRWSNGPIQPGSGGSKLNGSRLSWHRLRKSDAFWAVGNRLASGRITTISSVNFRYSRWIANDSNPTLVEVGLLSLVSLGDHHAAIYVLSNDDAVSCARTQKFPTDSCEANGACSAAQRMNTGESDTIMPWSERHGKVGLFRGNWPCNGCVGQFVPQTPPLPCRA